MTPTGSCPMTRPGATGYSPRTMWRSVPQIVVSVTRMTASPAPARGRSTSSIPNLWVLRKTFAFIGFLLGDLWGSSCLMVRTREHRRAGSELLELADQRLPRRSAAQGAVDEGREQRLGGLVR